MEAKVIERWVVGSGVIIALLFSVGCNRDRREQETPLQNSAENLDKSTSNGTEQLNHNQATPPKIYAKRFAVSVRAKPSQTSERLGYLRSGSVITTTGAPRVPTEECPQGWLELTTGGWVCDKRDVTGFSGDKTPERQPTQPDLNAPLPYKYGFNRRQGTPMYRRPPTADEIAQFEGAPTVQVDAGVAQVTEQTENNDPAPEQESGSETVTTTAETELTVPAPAKPQVGNKEVSKSAKAAATPVAVESTSVDNASNFLPEVPTLAALKGKRRDVLVRRLERGFYVSLDRELKPERRRGYWKTISSGFIPNDRLWVISPSTFRGFDLTTLGWNVPLAFVMSDQLTTFKRDDKGHLVRAQIPGYRGLIPLAPGQSPEGNRGIFELADGRFIKTNRSLRRIDVPELPKELQPGEKWIDVDLTQQTLVAYEGDRAVFATLISSGKVTEPGNPLRDHQTPVGIFRIAAKHIATTMEGDHAVDGPYSIEDVPYVMYFELAYALHSAFWHNAFGHTKSHGCVNMSPEDSKWVFNWSHPTVRPGWHGAFPSSTEAGTLIRVRGITPGAKR